MTVTFAVSPVKAVDYALPRVDLRALLTARNLGPIEACDANASTLCALPAERDTVDDSELGMHGFLAAMRAAFDHHCPLALAPDDVWLCIAQGFAQHVNANAEALRGRFVRHEGKATIAIRRDEFRKGVPNNPWPSLLTDFSDQIAAAIGPKRDLVVADFSTTGPVERAVSQVVLLDAMQSNFEYEFMSACGIPSITLLGAEGDWRALRARFDDLAEYDLRWWSTALRPVLDRFVAAAQGNVHAEFWRSIYKLNSCSGGPYVTGWCHTLFPYLQDRDGVLRRNPWTTDWERGLTQRMGGGAPSPRFPSGLASAPFTWTDRGTRHPMRFVGGFVGLAQTPDGLVRPAQAWAVCDAPRAP